MQSEPGSPYEKNNIREAGSVMAITGAKLTKISTDSGIVGDWLTNDSSLIFSGTVTLSGASTLGIELTGASIGTVSLGTVSLGAGAKAWTFDYTKSALSDGT
jgi:large repetitive protein